ncbi:Endonuclease/exonuclease/phosphatase, partial [Mycena floridula]
MQGAYGSQGVNPTQANTNSGSDARRINQQEQADEGRGLNATLDGEDLIRAPPIVSQNASQGPRIRLRIPTQAIAGQNIQLQRAQDGANAGINVAPVINRPPRTYRRFQTGRLGNGTQCRKTTKASTVVGSLNIDGLGSQSAYHPNHKWNNVNQIVKEKDLGFLIVVESHMDEERRDEVERLHGSRLKIVFSADPENVNSKGVAIVMNRERTNVENYAMTEIVPGRAILLETVWHNTERLSILGVYAPNDPIENGDFWDEIRFYFETHPNVRRPDIMGGDTNVVEDKLDRLPAHEDRDEPTNALDSLKTSLQLVDGWRETYPGRTAYTYLSRSNGYSQSRIDRIYIRSSFFDHAFEWLIRAPGVKTDHRMVSVRISSEAAPEIGKGRWLWPAHLMKDKKLTKYIQENGIEAQRLAETIDTEGNPRTQEFNAQVIFAKLKAGMCEKARERAKVVIPKMDREIKELDVKLDNINNDPLLSPEDKMLSSAVITEKLTKLELKRHRIKRENARAKNRLEGEVIGKYWSRINKPKKPKEIIWRLRKRNTHPEEEDPERVEEYTNSSQEMANLARNYHEDLQNERRVIEEETRNTAITKVLDRVLRTVMEEQRADLKKLLTEDDVREALKLSANNKAPGLDGILYELWRILDARYETFKRLKQPAFNALRLLQLVYNDIQRHGVVKGTHFSESWMAPLYKKKDKSDIANYRPISLLNTDYKIFTKALTIKL